MDSNIEGEKNGPGEVRPFGLPVKIKGITKKCVKWYFYPLIYYVVTSVVCAYAWYTRPIAHRAGIKVAYKTITLLPTSIWVAAITVWTALSIVLYASVLPFRKRSPGPLIRRKDDRTSQSRHSHINPSDRQFPSSRWRKTLNVSLSLLGTVLVVSGLSLAIWISRPYVTLLLSTSKIDALERKAKTGMVQGDRIIIPTALVDAPILEGVSMGQLSRGVCHLPQSPLPGKGGNCIVEGHNLAEFGWWRPQSFFSMLEVVEKGTPIYVFLAGRKYVYRVKEKTYRSVSDPKLYDFMPGERLTLLTCVSTWSPTIYTNRRTVIVAYPEST